MALHEHFRDYTNEEILQIKKDVCMKNNCPYLGQVGVTQPGGGKGFALNGKCCNYIMYTGKMRGCMPDDCKHYLDEGAKKKRIKNDKLGE